MNLNIEIKSFQMKHGSQDNPDALIIVGMGSDGWMYQYLGEEGIWLRLSKKFPGSIMLPGVAESPIDSLTTTNMDIEKPMTEEQAAEIIAPEVVPPSDASVSPE